MSKILITGATSGIGEALAISLAQKDNELILVGRNQDKLTIIKNKIENNRQKVTTLCLDLNNSLAVKKINNSIDILINCAGLAHLGPDGAMTNEEEMTNVNILAVVLLTKTYVKKFLKQGHGTIINIVSTSAFYPNPNLAFYGASKAFILNYTLAINEEVRQKNRNVVVKAICPGPTATNIFPASTRNKFGSHKFEMTPQAVAKKIVQAINGRQKVVIVGYRNIFLTLFLKITPLSLRNKILYKFTNIYPD